MGAGKELDSKRKIERFDMMFEPGDNKWLYTREMLVCYREDHCKVGSS